MKRLIVAALSLLALGTPAFAECKLPISDVVSDMTEKTGEDFGSSRQFDAKQYDTAVAVVKKYAKTVPEGIMGDGAVFIATAKGDAIFVAFTHDGKVCGAVLIPIKMANAIAAGDIGLADAPETPVTPPASAPAQPKNFEHHDTTES